MEIKPYKYFWDIAIDYIKEKEKELAVDDIYYIDKEHALQCVKFASLFKHTSGKLENKNFQFSLWQIHAIVDIFGQKYKQGEYKGLRRYQRAVFHMPKKNGKTETGALFHLIMFFLDPSLSKEQYCVASDKEQALILHDAIETMIRSNDYNLIDEIDKITIQPPRITKTDESKIYKQTITTLAKPIGDEKDGKKVTFFTSDEGHAQSSKNLYQLVKNGMALTEEPLEINLSTSGYNLEGYYYRDIYSYAKKVKDGTIKDDRFYSVIFELDESDYLDKNGNEIEDFWKDRKLWQKCNPNIGISPTYSFLEGLVSEAENSEESKIAFLTKHLNMWVDKPLTWIDKRTWQNDITFKLEDFKGKKAYYGLDLATTTDLNCLTLTFVEDNYLYVWQRYYLPKENLRKRVQKDKVPYMDWVADGHIKLTEGRKADHKVILNDILELNKDYPVDILGYDDWNANFLVSELEKNEITVIAIRQGLKTLSPATKELENKANCKELIHNNNPVLAWCVSNVVLFVDDNENVMPSKKKSIERIDGVSSLNNTISLYIRIKNLEEDNTSIYEERDLIDL